jgi:hypothetical protein
MAAGLVQNGTPCSRCMVPSGATADRAESAADAVPCWECIEFSRSVGAAGAQRCEGPEAANAVAGAVSRLTLGTLRPVLRSQKADACLTG